MDHRTDRSPFRIAIDARPLVEPPCGIRRHLEGLLPAVLETDPAIELHLIANREPEPVWRGRSRVTVEVAPWPMSALLRPVWERVHLPHRLRLARTDLWYSAIGAIPHGDIVPAVVTVQDLAFLKQPGHLPWRYRLYWRRLPRCWQTAGAVIVPSAATRDDMLDRTDIDPTRVTVIPHGVDGRFHPLEPAVRDARLHSLALDDPFVLWVGTREPRKNLGLLVAAVASLNRTRSRPVSLVLAGRSGWGASTAPRQPWMRILGEIDDDTLIALYGAASVFAFPSTDEGFGLPVVEAMACGAPVVVADAGSLPEIAGGAGVVLSPDNVEAWSRTLAEIVDGGQRARELRDRALRRAGDFSWTTSARHTVEVWRSVAAHRTPPLPPSRRPV